MPPTPPARAPAHRLLTGLYYLALGTWFGSTAMMGVAAANTFITVRAHAPTLAPGPTGLTDWAAIAPDYLAGNIVNRAFTGLAILQVACAIVLLVALVLQSTVHRHQLARRVGHPLNLLRIGLVLLPVLILAGDLMIARPAMADLRATRYDQSATIETRQAARNTFDAWHVVSERLLLAGALMTGAACLLSPFVLQSPAPEGRS